MGKRIRGWARRSALLLAVLVLVLAVGGVALGAAERATASQERIHRTDRVNLAESLATLANGYFMELDVAQAQLAGHLAPQLYDPAAARSELTTALADIDGNPLAEVTSADGTVELTTAGAGFGQAVSGVAATLADQARSGEVQISPVLWVDGQPRIVIAVPCGDTGSSLIIGYDLDSLPVAAYVQKLKIGPGAAAYVVDPAGRLVTSPVPARIGAPGGPVVSRAMALAHGAQVIQTPGPSPQVVAVAPVGLGGWQLVIVQPAPVFYGSLWHGDNVFRWALLGLVTVVAGALLVFHARRQAALQKVADMALVDPLTGLPNRLAFTQAVDAAMHRHLRGESEVALLFCDLDGFKSVNDRLGHAAGDNLLVAAAGRLRESVAAHQRVHPALARLGGDEFTVLLHGRDIAAAANALATELTDAFAEAFVLGPYELSVGVSVGVAYAHPDRDLLRDADVAMYRAKAVRKAAREAGTPDRYSAGAGEAPGPVLKVVPGA